LGVFPEFIDLIHHPGNALLCLARAVRASKDSSRVGIDGFLIIGFAAFEVIVAFFEQVVELDALAVSYPPS